MAKYTEVFESLQRGILEGKFAHGKRLPSEAELALRYQVSRPPAARALRELQQLGIITRRVGSGSYLKAAAAPTPVVARTFGLLVPGLGNTEILDPICNEITRFAQSVGCSVLWGDASEPIVSGKDAIALCQQYIARPVDGVFFAPIESIPDREKWNLRIADILTENRIPIVLLDRDLAEFPQRSGLDLIGIDNVTAAMELTQHLIDKGRRRICFMARPHCPSTTDLRLLGCREAIRRGGGADKYPMAYFGDPGDVAFVTKVLSSGSPDAIVCSNDQTAAILMRTLAQMGRRVPEELSIVGFDDVRYATLLSIPLTTTRQPCRDLGRFAVKTLIERIEDPQLPARHIELPSELIVRQSSMHPA